jgi:hypothetical protein
MRPISVRVSSPEQPAVVIAEAILGRTLVDVVGVAPAGVRRAILELER